MVNSASPDPASGANFKEVVTKDMDIDWRVDFTKKELTGTVIHTLSVLKDDVKQVIFDMKELTIESVKGAGGAELKWRLEVAPLDCFGQELHVTLPSGLKAGTTTTVTVAYSTSPTGASALQWLRPSQTASKKGPFLFSQCQAIHARSILPCMDTPAVKAPYTASVDVPGKLVALMSAVCENKPAKDADGRRTYKFIQKVPIPSYLVAVVVGALERVELSPRCAVWAESEVVDRAAKEFEDTEAMLQTSEALLGPYVWGRYDILVLPPSFPFGGMENPCLTFATPTLLAGDKSLATVIQHEITHSWTGNLVTNANWDHFWLNEGFTTFAERKATGRMLAKGDNEYTEEQYRQAQAIEGWAMMKYAVEHQFGSENHKNTRLLWDTAGTDPDDAFSVVPYEKGHAFLFYLEKLVGGPSKFEPWMRSYLDKFKYRSLTTEEWKAHFLAAFPDVDFSVVNWNDWFLKPGMPSDPGYDGTILQRSEALGAAWLSATPPTDASGWKKCNTQQKIDFLNRLLDADKFTLDLVTKMDTLYGLTAVKNSEIRLRWTRLALRYHYTPIIAPALDFVAEQGRMKLTRPVYKSLSEWEVSKEKAVAHFAKWRDTMHPLTASLVAKDLGVEDE